MLSHLRPRRPKLLENNRRRATIPIPPISKVMRITVPQVGMENQTPMSVTKNPATNPPPATIQTLGENSPLLMKTTNPASSPNTNPRIKARTTIFITNKTHYLIIKILNNKNEVFLAMKKRFRKGLFRETQKETEPSEEVKKNELRRYVRFRDACLYEAVSKCFRRVKEGNELPLSRILKSVSGRANTCFDKKMKSLYQGMLDPEQYFEEIFSDEEIIKTIHFVLAHKRINGSYDDEKKVFRKHIEEN